MPAPATPRLHLTPGPKPERVTPVKPRRKPAPGSVPAAPLQLPALPPRRVLPEPAESRTGAARTAPATAPAPTAPVPAAAPQLAAAPLPAGAGLSGGALLAADVALYRRETLLARWDLDDAELDALHADGTVVEVSLGRLARYVPAEDVPAGLRSGAVPAVEVVAA